MRRDVGRPERPGISSEPENAWQAARIVMEIASISRGDNLERATSSGVSASLEALPTA